MTKVFDVPTVWLSITFVEPNKKRHDRNSNKVFRESAELKSEIFCSNDS